MEEEKDIQQKLKQKVEEKINNVLKQGIESSNLNALYQLVDIHKDIANEEYWKKKEEVMENEIQRRIQ